MGRWSFLAHVISPPTPPLSLTIPLIPLHVSLVMVSFSKVVLDVLFNLIPPTDHMLEGGWGTGEGTEICSASCTCLGLDLPIYRQT